MPGTDEQQLGLVAEKAANSIGGNHGALPKELSSSCSGLLLDLPLLFLVLQPTSIVCFHIWDFRWQIREWVSWHDGLKSLPFLDSRSTDESLW